MEWRNLLEEQIVPMKERIRQMEKNWQPLWLGYDKREDGIEILNYFGSKQICYALELYDVQKFQKPLTLQRLRQLNPKIQIPQYYTYIKPDSSLYKELLHLNNQVGRVNEM